MNITHQKYLVMAALLGVNVFLIGLFIRFDQNWYAFLAVLALATVLNACSVLLVLLSRMTARVPPEQRRRPKRNYLYVMPCYDESKDELAASIQALARQRTIDGDTFLLVILCDGVARTAETLKQILGIGAETQEERYAYDYDNDNDSSQEMSVFRGLYQQCLPFVLCAKDKNRGKRDSLVLVRRLCLRYNTSGVSWILGRVFWGHKIDYIIGLDADTVLDDECAFHLIEGIEKNTNIYGCVGYVDVAGARARAGWRRYMPFNWYQYAEYMFAQCLKRQAQSCLTGKVSCLSGCNQILRVAEETCGEDLLKVFNRRPAPTDSIFTQIRGYASEDRNHVGLMLSMYPHVQTTQALQATAYTQVPQSVAVFLSQRRRWNLGAGANDMLLVTLPHINVFERIAAAINVLTYAVNPFIFVATIWFLKALMTNPTMLMLYLSIIMMIPLCYILLIPIFVRPLPFREALYFYGGMLLFLSTGILVNLATYFYSLTYMDEISWGKTRRLQPPTSKTPKHNTLPVVNLMTARESYV